jgi:rhomboid protease GluP
MEDIGLKLKLIFIPFVLVQAGFAALYSFFNYYMFIQRDWLHLDEAIANFAIPAVLAFIPVIVFLLPRLRFLDGSQKKKNPVAGGIIMAFFVTAVTTLTVQNYLLTAAGKLTSLQNISQMGQLPKTKYYTLKQHYTDVKDNRIYFNRHTSGKGNTRLDFDAYIVAPIYNSLPDTTQLRQNLPHAWLGRHYGVNISNRISTTEKEQAYAEFKATTLANFRRTDADDFIYLDRLGNNKKREFYKNALGEYHNDANLPTAILEPYKRPFAQHNGNSIWWILLAFAGGSALFSIILFNTPLDKAKAADYIPINPGDYSNWKN